MIKFLTDRVLRFKRDENGQMLIEFALVIPLVFTMFMTSVEMGIYQLRNMFLDRGMDLAIRQVRLNTSAQYDHGTVKQMICDFAGFLEHCDEQLKLEMVPVDLRSFTGLPADADCTDASEDVAPNRAFTHGGQHEMMLMRACYKFRPVFATSGLGYHFAENGDGAGMAKMLAVSAFVQEP